MKKDSFFIRNCAVTVCALSILGVTGFATCIRNFREIQEEIVQTADQYPDLIQKTEAVIEKTDDALSERLAFRRYFASLDSNLKYFLTGGFASNQVLLGKENWLFYKTTTDGDPMADYIGKERYSEEKMRETAWNMEHFQTMLERKGIRFAIAIIPNKEEVYGRYLPDTIQKEEEKNRTDLLVEYLRAETDIPIIYPKEELCSQGETQMLYYKNDTHWNQKGAFVTTQVLLEQLYGREKTALSDQNFETVTLQKADPNYNDLSRMVGMDWKFYDTESYEIIRDQDKEKIEETVLLVGDSFGAAFLPCLQEEFEEVQYCRRDEETNGILETLKPDLVILEYVERYTGEMDEFVWDKVSFTSVS